MQKKITAVRYLRSSKDRADVSIEAQRHELDKLAAERDLHIVGEFVDVVESGKDDDRPGFQSMLDAVRRRDRGWSLVMVLDTSRLARRVAIAVRFEELASANGVSVLYKSLPQAEEAERALIKSVLHGVDEWHSLSSKRKGIAGMRQNVKQGYRAGGRAPFGYKLEYLNTGAIRDGKPVLKSKLVPAPEADLARAYLKARAAGAARSSLTRRLGIALNESSLVGVEWNALTYAGHTVWNVHAERLKDGYAGGQKRRPRAAWEIKRDTHEALITDAEAEALLTNLELASAKRPRRTSADYLLTGLLRTSEGAPWYGERLRYYRTGNAYVAAPDVDQAIVGKIAQDLRSEAFSATLVRQARASYGREFDVEIDRLRSSEGELERRISRFMDMAEKLDTPGPVLRKVNELEQDRKVLTKQMDQARRDAATASAARAVTADQVGRMLDALATDMQRFDRDKLKDFLRVICERVTLNPKQLTARIHYKIPLVSRDSVASPREFESIPHGKTVSYVTIRRAA